MNLYPNKWKGFPELWRTMNAEQRFVKNTIRWFLRE